MFYNVEIKDHIRVSPDLFNLSKEELKRRKEKAEKIILDILKERSIKLFSFTLTKKQVETLNNFNNKIAIRAILTTKGIQK